MRFTRSSGILLHPTSLPGPFGSGDLGASSYHFVDWLLSAGQSLWQMLPIGPIGLANSPYMSSSAFAGSPLLIDLNELAFHGWLSQNNIKTPQNVSDSRVEYSAVSSFRMMMLKKASRNFFNKGSLEDKKLFQSFCEKEAAWLEDYATFQALSHKYKGREWTSWDAELVHRDRITLKRLQKNLIEQIKFQKFTQWCFTRQWKNLKKYANGRGVKLVGDIPIYFAQQSADVWSNPGEFYLDKDGYPAVVAGVPPDYFSEDGQLWGNPLYRWDVMKQNNYKLWIERFHKIFELFDIIRIDHFRGFESYWEIPVDEETAKNGRWVKGPGEDFFKIVKNTLGELPIIAEDLGIITQEVRELREKLGFPGMKVLQFAFAEGTEHPFLPHKYEHNFAVYTGTHDNDTTCGWYEKATEHERDFVRRYCKTDGHEINWDLINLALQSVADISIIPFQDVIGIGSEGRMNYPGTVDGNWEWRFTWDQVGPGPSNRLRELSVQYERCSADNLSLVR